MFGLVCKVFVVVVVDGLFFYFLNFVFFKDGSWFLLLLLVKIKYGSNVFVLIVGRDYVLLVMSESFEVYGVVGLFFFCFIIFLVYDVDVVGGMII